MQAKKSSEGGLRVRGGLAGSRRLEVVTMVGDTGRRTTRVVILLRQ